MSSRPDTSVERDQARDLRPHRSADRLQHGRVDRPVHTQKHDRFLVVGGLADLRGLDVDGGLAEQRADPAHHAGAVGVLEQQHLALGAQVEVPAVDLDQLLHLSPAGERAGHGDRLAVRHRRAQLHDAAVVLALRSGGQLNVDTALGGQGGRVDERDLVLDDVREHPAQGGELKHRDVLGGQLTGDVDRDCGGQPPGEGVEHGAELLHQRQPRPDLLADHAPDLHVHRIRHELACERELDGQGDVGASAVLRLVGGGAEVRGDDHLRQLEQRAGGGGLGDVDVDARAADVAAAHGLGQRVLVDETAAGGIDDEHALLGDGELVLADETQRVRGLRQMDRDHIGPAQQVLAVGELDAQLGGAGRGDVRVVGDQVDAERGEPLGDELADLAETDDADGLAVQLDARERTALPLALPQGRVGRRDVPRGGEQQRDRVLGGGDDVGRGRVDDHDAARGGGGDVDVVQADAGTGDDLQPGGGGERLGVDLGGRADEQGVGVGDRGQQRGAVGAVHVADLDVVTEEGHRGRRELLGEQDDRAGGGGAHGGLWG